MLFKYTDWSVSLSETNSPRYDVVREGRLCDIDSFDFYSRIIK